MSIGDLSFARFERISLRGSSSFTEKWVEDRIIDDPTLLGLGKLTMIQRQRSQPRAGRLDLLLQDLDSKRRYEVELQLGKLDESHLIRAVEYWDIERKRYPQYQHCAVLIAEDITSRFLNVISLFNGAIPLIALQIQAVKVGSSVSLILTKVVDELTRGLVDGDEEDAAAPADRSYWEKNSSISSMTAFDNIVSLVKEIDPLITPKFNKVYIGFEKNREIVNFVTCRPQKARLKIEPRLPQSDETDALLTQSQIDGWDYDGSWGRYRLPLTGAILADKRDFVKTILKKAYDEHFA